HQRVEQRRPEFHNCESEETEAKVVDRVPSVAHSQKEFTIAFAVEGDSTLGSAQDRRPFRTVRDDTQKTLSHCWRRRQLP
ncbi:hypothetical protein, partial [Bradyrhizobium sp. NAS80.1]|uniref:hypothetical protein n=1 Tax=Bradyrhizobium sp. NAS80.1 TaxID=1680159 RepID=UPI001AEFFE4C